jgi:hypothetical protein
MMRFLRTALFAALLPFVFTACNRDDDDKTATVDPQHDFSPFFPLQPGHFVTYDVDSTRWDALGCTRTDTRCQLRYQVADTFSDARGRRSYRVDIYYRKQDSLPWRNHQVLYVTPTAQRIEYEQDEVRYIKLVFPVANGSSWNGNQLIPTNDADLTYFRDWIYKYDNLGEAFDTERKYYNNTVTVNAVDRSQGNPEDPAQRNNYAERTYMKEVYANNVGLIFREFTRWTYNPSVAFCRQGFSVTMRAVDNK